MLEQEYKRVGYVQDVPFIVEGNIDLLVLYALKEVRNDFGGCVLQNCCHIKRFKDQCAEVQEEGGVLETGQAQNIAIKVSQVSLQLDALLGQQLLWLQLLLFLALRLAGGNVRQVLERKLDIGAILSVGVLEVPDNRKIE